MMWGLRPAKRDAAFLSLAMNLSTCNGGGGGRAKRCELDRKLCRYE